jgi:hypothetical protein
MIVAEGQGKKKAKGLYGRVQFSKMGIFSFLYTKTGNNWRDLVLKFFTFMPKTSFQVWSILILGGIKYKKSTIGNQSINKKYFFPPMGPQRGGMKNQHV